jgi:hypothetical protein
VSTQAHIHRGLCLSQPAVPVRRDHRCTHPRSGGRWQAWPGRADPGLSMPGLSHDFHCPAPHSLVPFENAFSSSCNGAVCTRLVDWMLPLPNGSSVIIRPPSPRGSLAQAGTLSSSMSDHSATCTSRISSWTNYEPGCAAPNRSSGYGWPSIPSPRLSLCFSLVLAHKRRLMCSSTPYDRSWHLTACRSSPVMASICTSMLSHPILDTGEIWGVIGPKLFDSR